VNQQQPKRIPKDTVNEPEPAPWTSADVTTEEDVDRNTHSVKRAQELRRQAEELAAAEAS
jgi:hypothetical protein